MSLDMVDVFPTLLGLAGVDPVGGIHGEDYAERIRAVARGGEIEGEVLSFVEEPPHLCGWRVGEWKLVRRDRNGVDVLRLYDLARDPSETIDLSQVEWQRTLEMGSALDGWLEALRSGADRPADVEAGGLDPETRRQLKALGYVD
jgi:arylsulfatase A-like enzyme